MEFKIPPWKHQLKAIERARELNSFGLFFEQGTGKTSTSINIAREKMNKKKKFFRTLVLAPIIVLENWKKEWFANSEVEANKIIILTGPEKDRCLKLTKAWSDAPRGLDVTMPKVSEHYKGLIIITNYEGLLMKNLFAMLKLYRPELMIIDESQRIKTYNAKRTKLAIELAKSAAYKMILSGTPILNSPMDIFSQFYALDGGDTFGKNFFGFRNMYFYDKNAGMPKDRHFPDWQIRPGSLDEINRKMQTITMRVEKKDCLDLPPMVRQTIETELTGEQKRVYNEVKKDLVSYIASSACVAQLAMTKALRLMQIASGYVKLEDGREFHFKDNEKQKALKELLEDLTPHSKVIIWAVFKENYEQIRETCDGLGIKYVEVHGEISNSKKFENVQAFNQERDVRVFIGHPGSGGIGINLIASNVSIWFSRNFSLENDLQAEARNYRGGSEIHDKITRIDLVAKETIEPIILEKLANKEEIGERLLQVL